MIHTLDLVDHVIQCGSLLAQHGGAGEVLNGGGVHIGRIRQNHHAVVGFLVRLGEVDGLTALGGIHHTGDDGVDLTLIQGVDEAVPAELDDHQLLTQLVGDDLGDLHIVALSIGARYVFNGVVGVAGFAFLPVAGGVGTLHAHPELAALRSDLAFCGGGLLCVLLGRGTVRRGAAGDKSQQAQGSQQGCGQSSEVHNHLSFLSRC